MSRIKIVPFSMFVWLATRGLHRPLTDNDLKFLTEIHELS